ncbi:MAG: glycosyltransferase family 92 protein [Selenomonadaceae bacterium]|nr:glycosyltransferase family 92 protein [Selenomonadaceae bacterium]
MAEFWLNHFFAPIHECSPCDLSSRARIQHAPVCQDALKRYRADCRYMGFIDIYEFLLPLQSTPLLPLLNQLIEKEEHAAGIAINCKSFGSSGWENRPTVGGVLDNFVYRAPDGYQWSEFPWKWDAHIKSIVNPRLTVTMNSAHFATYQAGKFAIDENGHRVDGMDNFVDHTNLIRINHYFTKSKAEWVLKRNKGIGDGQHVRPMEEFDWRDRNDVYDDLIIRHRNQLMQQHLEQLQHRFD